MHHSCPLLIRWYQKNKRQVPNTISDGMAPTLLILSQSLLNQEVI